MTSSSASLFMQGSLQEVTNATFVHACGTNTVRMQDEL